MMWPGTRITPVERCSNYWLKREDLAYYTTLENPSGAKVRQFLDMAKEQPNEPMVVGCSSYSAMQIYVAWAAKQAGVPAHIFVPRRKERTEATKYAESMGATIHEVFPGYATVYRARARAFAKEIGGCVRWDSKRAIHDTALQCMNLPMDCKRVLVPTGSGITAAGVIAGLTLLQRTDIEVVAVCVSNLADRDNIQHNADFMIQFMTQQFTDPFLMHRKPILTMIRAEGDYDYWRYETTHSGDVLDPFYSAKLKPYIQSKDVLWLSGMRPIQSCPDEWQELFWKDAKELMATSTPFY